jgi:hypothetical protein
VLRREKDLRAQRDALQAEVTELRKALDLRYEMVMQHGQEVARLREGIQKLILPVGTTCSYSEFLTSEYATKLLAQCPAPTVPKEGG